MHSGFLGQSIDITADEIFFILQPPLLLFFLTLPLLIVLCPCIEIVHNTNTLFYKVLCKVY